MGIETDMATGTGWPFGGPWVPINEAACSIAGGLVTEGKVHAKDKARVIRDGIVIRTADIGALKRYKDDVKEVVTGMECGLSLVNYNDIQEGDVIETFTEIEVEQKL